MPVNSPERCLDCLMASSTRGSPQCPASRNPLRQPLPPNGLLTAAAGGGGKFCRPQQPPRSRLWAGPAAVDAGASPLCLAGGAGDRRAQCGRQASENPSERPAGAGPAAGPSAPQSAQQSTRGGG